MALNYWRWMSKQMKCFQYTFAVFLKFCKKKVGLAKFSCGDAPHAFLFLCGALFLAWPPRSDASAACGGRCIRLLNM